MQVNIRTTDRQWAAANGTIATDEGDAVLVTVTATNPERLTFAGRDMVRFDLGDTLPRDYPNRWVLTPATFIAFDDAAFRTLARQFAGLGAEYAALGLTAEDAAVWANRGFLAAEAAQWIAAGFTPGKASLWANRFISPDEALTRLAATTPKGK